MLREVSDTEDSFSPDEEEEASGGGNEGVKDAPPFLSLPPSSPSITAEASGGDESAKKKEGEGESAAEAEAAEEDKGDPEMAPVYLKRLLPIFTELFHSSLAPALRSAGPSAHALGDMPGMLCSLFCRKESLRLLRKMCRYITAEWLGELCAADVGEQWPPFPTQISEMLAVVLEDEVGALLSEGLRVDCYAVYIAELLKYIH